MGGAKARLGDGGQGQANGTALVETRGMVAPLIHRALMLSRGVAS